MSRVAWALALLLVGAPADAREARVVAGRDLATLVPPDGVAVETYSNHGYRLLRNRDGTVSIEVDLRPVASGDRFELPAASRNGGPVSTLARALVADARTRYEAATRLLGWIASQVEYRLDREEDQSPRAVIERRSAYCTGSARLAVALLAAVGIEAREVPGYVVEQVPGGPPPGFHRWIEIRYDDRGWVFSDPMISHHFVPATYLRLADEALVGQPGRGVLVDRRAEIREIDLVPAAAPAGATLRLRPNDDLRRTAALALRLEPGVDGHAVLDGGGVRRRLALANGEGTFLGLEPGEYELRIEARGQVAAHKRVTFRNRVLAELRVPVGSGSGADGRSR